MCILSSGTRPDSIRRIAASYAFHVTAKAPINLISFTTRRYRKEPLVITGPGAGVAVTAAGILNDIQHLAAT